MINLKDELRKSIQNDCLINYLVKRFESNKYRGRHFTQHNRFTIEDIKTILNEMKKMGRIEILVGDDTGDYSHVMEYAKLVEKLKLKGVDTSINGLKKHFFVDMHRMGFIKRFNKNGKEFCNPFKKCNVKYVEISQLGKDFINENILKEQIFLYMKAIDKLSNGFLEKTHQFFLKQIENLSPEQQKVFKINRYDFALFILGIDWQFDNQLFDLEKISELFKIWNKTLSMKAKHTILNLLKQWCDERKKLKKQSTKKDWGNFLNNCDQIIDLFSQTSFFERDDKYNIYLKFGNAESMFDDIRDCCRSLIQKHYYFEKHKISKSRGYRLHHVIKLSQAKNIAEYKMLDVWENMIYIYGGIHDEIHDSDKDKLYILKIHDNNEIDFVSIFNKDIKITCEPKYSHFNLKLKDTMLSTNKKLLKSLN